MAPTDNTVARTLHDLGLAAWFGGSLMGATGVNGAAAVVQDPTQRLRVANTGWGPLDPPEPGRHRRPPGRRGGPDRGQQGPPGHPAGRRHGKYGQAAPPPTPTTPEEVARAQRQLTALQWVIPILTGAVLVVNARMGEQQRPGQVSKGLVRRLLPGR